MTHTRRGILRIVLAASIAATVPGSATAAKPAIYANDGVAIDGTDAVAYFTQGRPVKGTSDLAYRWKGVNWHFANEENRAAFMADPERYAPQYGGYCAFAVSRGYTASTVPDAWKIVNGKLYLNYSRSIQRRWERDVPSGIKAADRNWPRVLK